MNSRNIRVLLIGFAAILLSSTYGVFLFRHETKQKPLPVLGQVRDFHLFDEKGREFSLKQLEGDIWIANFFFTTCGDICPIMSKNMAALQRSFHMIDNVKHVSISVNPEYDSPNVLNEYGKKYQAKSDKWHFLTGTRGQIKQLAVDSFKLGDIKEPVFHSSQFALVDQHGLIRGYYDGVQSGEVSQLFKDVAMLLKK